MTDKPKLIYLFLKHWMAVLSVLGLGVGVVGIAITIYLYNPGTERLPTLLVDPVRTPIIDSKLFPNSSLKVTRADNVVVQGDVTALTVYFWNAGSQSIRPENVVQPPLTISLNDEGGEILDYKILKVSRPDVVKMNVLRSDNNPSRELMLGFNILEQSDGFSCQIIYEGNPSAALSVSGVIEGVKTIRSAENISGGRFWGELFRLLPIYLAILIGIVLIKLIQTRVALWRASNLDNIVKAPPTPRGTLARALSYVLVGTIAVLMVFIFFILLPRESARTNVVKEVPSSIRP